MIITEIEFNKCRTTESVCKFLDSISLGTCKVKISEEDLKRIKQLTGKESARKTYNKNKGSEKKINKSQLKKAENTNLDDLLKSYPLFQIWPQVLKQILLVSFELKTQNLSNIDRYVVLHQEKQILTEEEMPEKLKETSTTMKKGRSYKNIYAILNKYPRRRMGYIQTAGKVSTKKVNNIVFISCIRNSITGN